MDKRLDSESSGSGIRRIAFFLQDLDGGGAERAVVRLSDEAAKKGYKVDLVVGDADSDYRLEVSPRVRMLDFSTRSPFLILLRLIAYLRKWKPTVIMSCLDVPNILLVIAAKLSAYKGRFIISQRAVVFASLRELTQFRRSMTLFLQRNLFPKADSLISNSFAAASEVQDILGVSANKIFTIHNALDVERIKLLAVETLDDQWFSNNSSPMIVSVGSITERKDMGTLIKAFAMVRKLRNVRLAIIGKGDKCGETQKIKKLISDLAICDSVHLPGFDPNPYKWIAASAVFVSSSKAEGFPNVIAEALSLGCPVVATDCPGDTAELLEHGKWGRLVPVGDSKRMAEEIMASLDDPSPADGRIRAAEFSPEKNLDEYLKILLARRSKDNYQKSMS